MMVSTIACVGGLTLDWLQRGDAREGPYPGGNALYAAIGAWLASATPIIVARIGRDYPPELVARIAAHNLSTTYIRRTHGRSYRVLLRDDAEEREVRYLEGSGSNRNLDPSPEELPLGRAAAAHVCPARASAQLAILERCQELGWHTTLDILFVTDEVEPTQYDILTLLPHADAFLPSWAEIRRVWPDDDPTTAVRRLQDSGCCTVVIKMGAEGCLGGDGELILSMPPIPAVIVDTTGAGDAFCGAFHAKWIETRDLGLSMAWGSAAASIVIEGHGALHAIRESARARAADRSRIGLERIVVWR